MKSLLTSIHTPENLRQLSRQQLPMLADELRAFLLGSVAKTGGHLSSNLGTVELSIALHYGFNTPTDRLIWDVGHQAYTHKMLTGRRNRMHSLRKLNGLSGFPHRDESAYDAFGTAHSSTSISAALGMAIAARQKKENFHSIAVIGDGAMTAGMAFEALHHASVEKDLRLLIILNDNSTNGNPPVGVLSANWVKNLGFNYVGPIDGHDIEALLATFYALRQCTGLQFLHVFTQKGKGYVPAEADPIAYHGVNAFDLTVGLQTTANKPTYSQIFGDWLCDMAQQDARLVGITPAMREGSGMVQFHKQYPNRYFDVGIAEQHAVTLAAGMACEGLKPVVAIYSTFLQRAYDQLIHDVALQNLPVIFAIDRAGLVGADGATHAGNYDIAFIRCIPNMALACPADASECYALLSSAFAQNRPVAVRYPRGVGIGNVSTDNLTPLPFGKGALCRSIQKIDQNINSRLVLVVFGTLLYSALEAAEMLDATVLNMRWVKPLDEDLLLETVQSHHAIVTIEDGCTMGGAGSAVLECLQAHGVHTHVLQLGLPDTFIPHGNAKELMYMCGLDAQGIVKSVRQYFG